MTTQDTGPRDNEISDEDEYDEIDEYGGYTC